MPHKIVPSYFLLLLLIAATTATARPARVVLLRHAEKPPQEATVHLSERGQDRARALVAYFTNAPIFATHGPLALFAPKYTKRGHSIRPYETLEPLARHFKLAVQMPYGPADYAKLAKHILTNPALNGKTVVVCWVHNDLADLARALEVKPKPARWKDDVYDRLWVITYKDHRALLTDLPQKLLPGDSAE
ncbi:MAG: hypothetical protein NT154_00275 [Verrucomicrobia bacterium]|nr:hypothetical protein [Verrucomicrobiota bacterium]